MVACLVFVAAVAAVVASVGVISSIAVLIVIVNVIVIITTVCLEMFGPKQKDAVQFVSLRAYVVICCTVVSPCLLNNMYSCLNLPIESSVAQLSHCMLM